MEIKKYIADDKIAAHEWRRRDRLNLFIAAKLIKGLNPNYEHHYRDEWLDGYYLLLTAIEDENIAKNHVEKNNYSSDSQGLDDYFVDAVELKRFLSLADIDADFFFPKKQNKLAVVKKNQPSVFNLEFWSLREWLTIDEATYLALGCDPSNKNYCPDGWEGLSSVLYEAVANSDGFTFDSRTVDFKEEGLNVDKTLIKVSAIKEWFQLKKMENAFFNREKKESINTEEIVRPEYRSRLMTIMYETINRYYSKNYDPNDRDTVTKQTDLVEWLETTYSLSNAEARAIDKMTRPEQSISPQGKK